MKKSLSIFMLFFISLSIHAEGFIEISFLKNSTSGEGGIPISYGFAGGHDDPNNFYVDEIGNILYFSHFTNGHTYRIRMDDFSSLEPIDLPYINGDPLVMRAYNGVINPLFNGYFLSGRTIFKDFEEIIEPSLNQERAGRAFFIGDYAFFQTSSSNSTMGNIRAFNIWGEELDTEQAVSQLREYTNQLSEEEQSRILPVHERMLETGQFIIVGDRYYLTDFKVLTDFYSQTYNRDYSEYYTNTRYCKFLAYDEDGNSYWYYDWSYTERYFDVLTPSGELISRNNYYQYYDIGDIRHRYVSCQTGNIYLSIANSDGTHIYKLNRTWGNPNMVTLAINGLDGTDYDDYVYEVLDEFTTEELRLQRNMVFALKDYRFSSQDLLEYYGQFNWYSPEKTIEEASAELTENQVRFVNYIRELEAERD